ncbi:Folate-dependent protein for Fe/S cluster synthesis/repair in oxidative stress [Klebsiella pneumoniae IS46]|nr:Folate-dependent protein for Fe/S cluster synthesis/repair in oxidative stress [Klebsiella pneumoniae IS46]
MRGEAQFNNSQQWLALNIEAGLPVIDSANSGQFIPQATNLQALGGISFKKGCYTGQEMVARAKFRGANKRALWTLSGTASRGAGSRGRPGAEDGRQLAPHRYGAGSRTAG